MDKPHILIIEDDPTVCELLFSCLSKEGYHAFIAQSGEAGLSQIEENPPAAIILDLNLPGMNGLDVCRAMRRDPWMSRIPVMMLTGQAEEDDVVAGLEVGADDYMTKPFSPKLLTARVKALLRRRDSKLAGVEVQSDAEKSPEILMVKTLGRCELRVAFRRLSWIEELSPAQRQLMAMLVSTPSGKVSQEEVQVALWPDSPSAKARSSFDSLLSRVRRTLDQALAPFDSKKYLVLKRGYLCLEHSLIDVHEFRRLIRKASQQLAKGELWPAEITFSSAFSLWRGTFVPGDFGCDAAISVQDDLEQLYLESSQSFARLLAQNERYPEAVKLLRDALRYDPTNDGVVRLLYFFSLVQEVPGQAAQVLKQYREALGRENFSPQEIDQVLQSFPRERPSEEWLQNK